MKRIRGMELIELNIGNVESFDRFRKLCRLILEPSVTRRSQYDMEMHLESCWTESLGIIVRFLEIHDLKINSTWGNQEIVLGSLGIHDISAHQLEGRHWRVEDYEDETIQFDCNDIEIVDVRRIDAAPRPPENPKRDGVPPQNSIRTQNGDTERGTGTF